MTTWRSHCNLSDGSAIYIQFLRTACLQLPTSIGSMGHSSQTFRCIIATISLAPCRQDKKPRTYPVTRLETRRHRQLRQCCGNANGTSAMKKALRRAPWRAPFGTSLKAYSIGPSRRLLLHLLEGVRAASTAACHHQLWTCCRVESFDGTLWRCLLKSMRSEEQRRIQQQILVAASRWDSFDGSTSSKDTRLKSRH